MDPNNGPVRPGHLPKSERTEEKKELHQRTPGEEEHKKAHLDRLSILAEHDRGFLRLGKTLTVDTAMNNGITKVHFGMLTYHREGSRAFQAAAQVEKSWGFEEGTVGIFLGFDAKHPAHYPQPGRGSDALCLLVCAAA